MLPIAKPTLRATREDGQGAQLGLRFRTWGGARQGAGRPRSSQRVSHLTRERVTRHVPLHVTLRLVRGLPSLRGKAAFRVVREALTAARPGGVRVVQYSIQSNHVHLVVEAQSTQALARGMQALSIRLAKQLNRSFERKGRVFGDRFHARALKTPLEVRRALAYVLNNFRRHADGKGPRLPLSFRDPMSSAHWFDGWDPEWVHAAPDRRALLDPAPTLESGVVAARSFLLRSGWRRHGLLQPFDVSDAERGLKARRAARSNGSRSTGPRGRRAHSRD
jgi:REP element-mobilizing transposase RayT